VLAGGVELGGEARARIGAVLEVGADLSEGEALEAEGGREGAEREGVPAAREGEGEVFWGGHGERRVRIGAALRTGLDFARSA